MALSTEQLVDALGRAFDSPLLGADRSHLSAAMIHHALAEALEEANPPRTIGDLRDVLACGPYAGVLSRIQVAAALVRWPADTPLEQVARELGEAEDPPAGAAQPPAR